MSVGAVTVNLSELQPASISRHRIDAPATDPGQIEQWHWQAEASAAIAELMTKIVSARSSDAAHRELTGLLCDFMNAQSVAVGVPRDLAGRVRVVTVSDVAKVDPSADRTLLHAEAMSEAILRERLMNRSISFSSTCQNDSMLLAHDRLRRESGSEMVLSCPMKTVDGEVVAVWTASFELVSSEPKAASARLERARRFADASSSPLAEAIRLTVLTHETTPTRWKRHFASLPNRRRGWIGLAMSLVLLALMMIPIPHRIGGSATLQPIGQRYAVAPNDGILTESLVRVGDLVVEGQTLAIMETTDLELRMAEVTARCEQARKRKDMAQAIGNASERQLAEWEERELIAELELLQHRISKRFIVSEIDGIVLSSEVDQAHGVPVQTGDVLMQVSPLDHLSGEVEIDEADISYLQVGQTARLIADGNPLEPIVTEVTRVRPVSEVRNGKNVFVAEVNVDNRDGNLRPGMKASSKVAAGYRAAGWIMFHHAIERLYGTIR